MMHAALFAKLSIIAPMHDDSICTMRCTTSSTSWACWTSHAAMAMYTRSGRTPSNDINPIYGRQPEEAASQGECRIDRHFPVIYGHATDSDSCIGILPRLATIGSPHPASSALTDHCFVRIIFPPLFVRWFFKFTGRTSSTS